MSKKHFIAIAEKINRRVAAVTNSEHMNGDERAASLNTLSGLANDLADVASECNDRFDRSRFMAACGIR